MSEDKAPWLNYLALTTVVVAEELPHQLLKKLCKMFC